ncbi:hypothetical protein MMC18_008291 [Xylographa bjoerkii]|nr:hypothetical protein [Xylographa bjoerkii]
MEALGAAASVVGIVSLGIQIGQILQKQIDDVRNADLRLLQIVYEIGATATSLQNLQALLLQDEENPSERIFSRQCYQDIVSILNRCNVVFRNITVLVAKSGTAVLALVDDFQRKMNNSGSQDKDRQPVLDIELSSIEHLIWPWRLPKIEQYIADLDRLKQTLLLILAVNALAQKTILTSDSDAATLYDDDEDALLVDEVFYRNMDYQESERNYAHSTTMSSDKSHASSDLVAQFQKSYSVAEMLVQNWPHLPEGGVPSPLDLAQMGVILQAFTLKTTKPGKPSSNWMQMPVTLGAIQDHMLRNSKGMKAADTVWSRFSRLPEYQQYDLSTYLANLVPPVPSKANINGPTLLSIDFHTQRRLRAIERLKSLTPFYGHGFSRSHLTIVVAWIKGPPDQSSRPISRIPSKPLIESPMSYKVSRQIHKLPSHERLRPTGREIRWDDLVTSKGEFEGRRVPSFQYPSDNRERRLSSYKDQREQANASRHLNARNNKYGRALTREDFRSDSRSADSVVNSRRHDNYELQAQDQDYDRPVVSDEEQHARRQIEYGEAGSDHSDEADRGTSVIDSGEESPSGTSSTKKSRKQNQPRKGKHSADERKRFRKEIKLARDKEKKLKKRQTELEHDLQLQEERYRIRAKEAAIERRELELELELEGQRRQRVERETYHSRPAGLSREYEGSYGRYHDERDFSTSMPFRPGHQVRYTTGMQRDRGTRGFGIHSNNAEVSRASDWGVTRIPPMLGGNVDDTLQVGPYTGRQELEYQYTRPHTTRTEHNGGLVLPPASTFRSERFEQYPGEPLNDSYAQERHYWRSSEQYQRPYDETQAGEYSQVRGNDVDVPPTEEEKRSVAQYYIRKWTTTIERMRDVARKRLKNRKERFYNDGQSPPEPFLHRPSAQQPKPSTTTQEAESDHEFT